MGTALTAVARSDAGSAACRLCWPMGDRGPNEDRVGNVGSALVVKRRCSCARSADEDDEEGVAEAKCEPMGRMVGA
jgi:hypothetical protein